MFYVPTILRSEFESNVIGRVLRFGWPIEIRWASVAFCSFPNRRNTTDNREIAACVIVCVGRPVRFFRLTYRTSANRLRLSLYIDIGPSNIKRPTRCHSCHAPYNVAVAPARRTRLEYTRWLRRGREKRKKKTSLLLLPGASGDRAVGTIIRTVRSP